MRKIYCDKNDNPTGSCAECALSSYNRDCRNNLLECPDPPAIPEMSKARFDLELNRALAFLALTEDANTASYWSGYARGVRRAFHGKNYSTDGDHLLFLCMVVETNPRRHAMGVGYRDGLIGKTEHKEEVAVCQS